MCSLEAYLNHFYVPYQWIPEEETRTSVSTYPPQEPLESNEITPLFLQTRQTQSPQPLHKGLPRVSPALLSSSGCIKGALHPSQLVGPRTARKWLRWGHTSDEHSVLITSMLCLSHSLLYCILCTPGCHLPLLWLNSSWQLSMTQPLCQPPS